MVASPALRVGETEIPSRPWASKEMRLLRAAALWAQCSWQKHPGAGLGVCQRPGGQLCRESQQGDLIPVVPFSSRLLRERRTPSFSVQFIEAGVRYEYGLRCNTLRCREWLYAYPQGRPQVVPQGV